MNAPRAMALAAVIFFRCAIAWALPSQAEIRAFDEELARERAAFEQEMRNFAPGPATKEIEVFRKSEAARKIAFDARTQGMPLEEKKAAIDGFVAEKRAAESALRGRLQALDSSPVRSSRDLTAFRKARIDSKLKLDQAMQGMTLDEKRAAIEAFNAAARADDAAQTAALRAPVIEENVADKRRDFQRRQIEKQRAFYGN